jgi:hypothetical protein
VDRVNVVNWSDGLVLTRRMATLQEQLMHYQPYSLIDPDTGRPGRGILGGDGGVIVEAIYLRDQLVRLIDKSNLANKR